MPSSLWDRTYAVNVRGTFLTIKHFLKSIETAQLATGEEVRNVSVVVTGSECGVFGQAGHVEYASGKAGLQYGLVKTVKNEIVRLNKYARINAVAPGWVDTKLIEGRLNDPEEMWREAEATYVTFYFRKCHVERLQLTHAVSHCGRLHSPQMWQERRHSWQAIEQQATSQDSASLSMAAWRAELSGLETRFARRNAPLQNPRN